MKKKIRHEHLTDERLQALAEGELPRGELVAAEEHLSACPRCRADLEAWKLLFGEIASLAPLSPTADFQARVMARVEIRSPETARQPLAARVMGWLGRRSRSALDHLSPERLQDYVDGALPARSAARLEAHMGACAACRTEAAGWKELHALLGALPAFQPSRGFADRVMARVRVRRPAPAPAGRAARARRWVGGLLPAPARVWAVLAGLASVPAAATVGVAYLAFSHPLVTPGNLLAYAWLQASSAASVVAEATTGRLLESTFVFEAWTAIQGIAGSPGTVALAGLTFSLLSVVALWVLRRNLFHTRSAAVTYAQASL